VRSNVEQNQLSLWNLQDEGNAVGPGDADGVQAFQATFQSMQTQMALEGVCRHVSENSRESPSEIRVGPLELGYPPVEVAGRYQRKH
jgi:hypothetical protein